MTVLYNITLTSDVRMPKCISDKVLNPSCMLVDMDRQWELEVCIAPGTRGMTIWMLLDSDGNQIGDTTFGFDDGDGNEYAMSNLDLNPEVCRIIGLFLAKDFETITNMLFENAKAREVEERGLLGGKGDYQLDVALGGSNEGA